MGGDTLEEYFDLRREDGSVTGEVKARSLVHLEGDLHGTVHIWILRPNGAEFDLLLQKRSRTKDAFPGCWDISSAGHLPAGSDFLESALRELEEELGIAAKAEDLILLGFNRRITHDRFYNKPFRDNEFSALYLYMKPVDLKKLRLQEEEVADAAFFPYSEIIARLEDPTFCHCLQREELQTVENAYRNIIQRSSL
ncbi:MAG: NUDIX domain-containing protein [Oscillospiraceae bacterium]|nr:NUDIX domain-containing protein [Oscillospiraceae bacterium]